ncbi:hypothetical protein AWB76_07223 [Caballeronia temeraria]|uniref:Uncharacterized protein n=1 Tax=Caballeronia temeraria TaxID=1777137 RepID=A0A158DMS0_9BURK|nr:hypothetical protein AWB76_07223 [Caballeronia temeraria]
MTTPNTEQAASVVAIPSASLVTQTQLSSAVAPLATSAAVVALTGDQTVAGTKTFTGPIVPTSTQGIKGTATNDNAPAGAVGEYVEAIQSSNVSLPNATATNITSISLSPGDWDVSGVVVVSGSGAVLNNSLGGVSIVSATIGALGTYGQLTVTGHSGITFTVPTSRYTLTTTTTVYLVGYAGFTSGSANGTGKIRARRVR